MQHAKIHPQAPHPNPDSALAHITSQNQGGSGACLGLVPAQDVALGPTKSIPGQGPWEGLQLLLLFRAVKDYLKKQQQIQQLGSSKEASSHWAS